IYLFTKTKNHTLVATTYLDNVKSQNVLLKLGFIFTDQVDRLVDNIYVKFNLYKLKKDAYERKELPWQNITTNT
ncbi:MAG: GNAT family protein, partial [Acholeplasmataceae bacterium]